MTQPHAKIIALVGLAGSGKSSAVEYLTKKGFPKVYFGGVIYKAMEEAGIEPTWDLSLIHILGSLGVCHVALQDGHLGTYFQPQILLPRHTPKQAQVYYDHFPYVGLLL